MYLKIDLETYTKLENIEFSPEVDLTASSMPINEFTVDVYTTNTIALGQFAELYDDLDNLWAKYWIVYSERLNADALRLRARSRLSALDGVTLDAVMYNNASVPTVLQSVMVSQTSIPGMVATIDYSLDSSFNSATLTGFCPEQTARERLTWICLVIGAYVKTFFNDEPEILPIDATEALVPVSDTFWRPTVTYKDHVSAVKVKSYSFAQGTPATTDEWVTDGTNYYIVTEADNALANPDAPSGTDNPVTIEGVYLINSANVSAIMSRFSQMAFKRTEVELDIIDNAERIPGDKLVVYSDVNQLMSGFAASCDFAFGKQARAKVKLIASETKQSARLTITYRYSNRRIGRRTYRFPVGYAYEIDNPYIDWSMNGHQYVFRPTTAKVTGTMQSTNTSVDVTYAIALDLYEGALHVVSVDAVSVDSSGDYDVAVIS